MDAVAEAAGVAPTTLYRLFGSKDGLVGAYVERAGRLYRAWFTGSLESGGPGPRDRLLAFFDALVDQIQPERCRGCPFQMALAELPDADRPARAHAVDTKEWMLVQLEAHTQALGVEHPAKLAAQLMVLIEGVYALAQSLGADGAARATRALVEALLPARDAEE